MNFEFENTFLRWISRQFPPIAKMDEWVETESPFKNRVAGLDCCAPRREGVRSVMRTHRKLPD